MNRLSSLPKIHARKLAMLLCCGLLSACAVAPPPKPSQPTDADRAQRVEATGNFEEAAQLWQRAAMVAVGPDRERFRLRAAEAWMRAGRPSLSGELLSQVEQQQLSGTEQSRFDLLGAELALEDADADRADFFLQSASSGLAYEMRERYGLLNERLNRLRRNPAAFALSTVAGALGAMGPYNTINGIALLQLLESIPGKLLAEVSTQQSQQYGLGGWPQLSLMLRDTLVSGDNIATSARLWASNNPEHEVTEAGFVELAQAYAQLYPPPRKIAVLLPGDGGLAAAGKAIRDGLISAYMDQRGNTQLQFFATDDTPESAISAYFSAVDDGADWVIGPLRRESVTALAGLGSLGVPALMLNNAQWESVSESDKGALFQMSLSQESEARSIASLAASNDWNSALVLVADTPWGRRMESAFIQAFEEQGGRITVSQRFDPTQFDHGELLTDILKIQDSIERKNRLQATLNITLGFEPVRRDDFDIIFLAANPEQGRQIRPQLRFHDAGDKPVLAMGRIFSGKVNRAADQDLNGVIFPSSQWQLSDATSTNSSLASLRGGSLGNLHALGSDAWRILPWLPLLEKDPDLQFRGQSGMFNLGQQGMLIRAPSWAQFQSGRPTPLQETSWQD